MITVLSYFPHHGLIPGLCASPYGYNPLEWDSPIRHTILSLKHTVALSRLSFHKKACSMSLDIMPTITGHGPVSLSLFHYPCWISVSLSITATRQPLPHYRDQDQAWYHRVSNSTSVFAILLYIRMSLRESLPA